MTRLVIVAWLMSFAAYTLGVESDEVCYSVPQVQNIWRIEEDLKLAESNLRRLRDNKERDVGPGGITEEKFQQRVKSKEWRVAYHSLKSDLAAGRSKEDFENRITFLEKGFEPGNEFQASLLLELAILLDEVVIRSLNISPSTAAKALQLVVDTPEESQASLRTRLLKIRYFAFFGGWFGNGNYLDMSRDSIDQLRGMNSVSNTYLDFLEAGVLYELGVLKNSDGDLEEASLLYRRVLDGYRESCSSLQTARTHYFLAKAYYARAMFKSTKPEERWIFVRGALEAMVEAREKTTLLNTPELWRVIHRFSSTVFDAAEMYASTDDRRKSYQKLSERSYELSVSF